MHYFHVHRRNREGKHCFFPTPRSSDHGDMAEKLPIREARYVNVAINTSIVKVFWHFKITTNINKELLCIIDNRHISYLIGIRFTMNCTKTHAKYTMHKESIPLHVFTDQHRGMLCQPIPSRTLFQSPWGACLLTSKSGD